MDDLETARGAILDLIGNTRDQLDMADGFIVKDGAAMGGRFHQRLAMEDSIRQDEYRALVVQRNMLRHIENRMGFPRGWASVTA